MTIALFFSFFAWTGHVFCQKFTPSDGTISELYGYTVSMSDNHLAVGAPGFTSNGNANQGAVYAYNNDNSVWSFIDELFASDGAENDFFGWSVSVSGDYLAAGADYHDAAEGAVYISYYSSGHWSQQAELQPSDGLATDQFGFSCSLNDNKLLAGAPTKTGGFNVYEGAAYVFLRSNSAWSQQGKLTASDGVSFDYFGWSCALSDSYAAVGAVGDTINGNSYQGAVYIFYSGGGSIWTQIQKLIASDGAEDDWFGVSLAISDSILAIGCDYDDVNSVSDQGSVYVYALSGSVWYAATKLTASDGAAGDNYGYAVSLIDGNLVVGSNADDVDAISNQGSAYVYSQTDSEDPASWTLTTHLIASDGVESEGYGWAVSVSGGYIAIAAPYDARDDIGSIYLYSNLNDDGAWRLSCPYGSYINETSCVDCSAGSYNDQVGATDCTSCPDGTTTMSGGSTSEASCFAPSFAPSISPSNAPTVSPSNAPTVSPSNAPTVSPSNAPTVSPSNAPSSAPTILSTSSPTIPSTSLSQSTSTSDTQMEESIGASVGIGCALLIALIGTRYYRKRKQSESQKRPDEHAQSHEMTEISEEGLTKGMGVRSDEYVPPSVTNLPSSD